MRYQLAAYRAGPEPLHHAAAHHTTPHHVVHAQGRFVAACAWGVRARARVPLLRRALWPTSPGEGVERGRWGAVEGTAIVHTLPGVNL